MASFQSIVCAGSSGGGKTTLAAKLQAEILKNDSFVGLISHSRPTAAAVEMGYPSASQIPADKMGMFQWYALFQQINAERRMESLPFIADRGVLDFLAYAMYQAPTITEDYVKIVKAEAEKYSMIVVVPPNSKGTFDNGIRHLHGVEEVHRYLLQLLDEFALNDRVLHLQTDTPEQRVQEVRRALQLRDILPFPTTEAAG